MHALRRLVRVLLGFSRRETNGLFVLAIIMVLVLFARPAYNLMTRKPVDFSKEEARLDSLIASWETNSETDEENEIDVTEQKAFPFDPNTASVDDLVKLGIKQGIATRMVRYRESGGRFTVRQDLLKIYGMDSTLYAVLYPYIKLPDHAPDIITVKGADERTERFDLNTADTAQLVRVYGIGPVLSKRIVKFREHLGGFVAPEQVYEVYGLDSATATRLLNTSYLKSADQVSQLNVNEATEHELSSHPYISGALAKAITAYRFQHGAFTTKEDIRKIHLVDSVTWIKIEPYLAID